MTTMMPMPMPIMPFPLLELPWELCLDVLTRLPLKYLMRLRCVSKFFLDLTNNPTFITSYYCSKSIPPPKDYFNFMDTTTPPTSLVVGASSSSNEWQWQWPWRFHMLFKGSNYIYIQKRHELIPFHCPNDKRLLNPNNDLVCFGGIDPPNDKRLINSINGLVCFGGIDTLEIYNIFAGTNYYLIPQILILVIDDPVFVFGYDPISNDYKILRIEHFCSWSMYSFATNSWKPMSLEWDYCTVYYNSERGRSVCINGVIYWPPDSRDHDHNVDKIILFNLHKEKFGVIQLPKEDLLLPTQYADIQLLSFRGCLAFAFINKKSSTTTTTRKRMRSGGRGGGGEGEKETSSSHGGGVVGGEIWVELFTLTDMNLSKKVRKIYIALKKKSLWNRQSFVVPIPSTIKEEDVEIVSCCDEIFLGWFESNQLRLYNLHTKCIFNLPLSPPSHYYPKASFMEKKDDPTYVDNLSFDFSLI